MRTYTTLHDFNNVGYLGPVRRFDGFPSKSHVHRHIIRPRDCQRIDVKAGDLLSVEGLPIGKTLPIITVDASGNTASNPFNVQTASQLDINSFGASQILGWLQSKGLNLNCVNTFGQIQGSSDVIALKASQSCTAWVIYPCDAIALAMGETFPEIELCKKPNSSAPDEFLPPVLGNLRDEFTVPRGTAHAYQIKKGEFVQLIDVEGQQCSDFMAFRTNALDQGRELMIDTTSTRSMVRGAYPTPGLLDKFYDAQMNPLMSVVQDTCGRHDAYGLACTARGYEDRGFLGHLNCSDNISQAGAKYGVQPRNAWPAINFFWNSWICEHSHQMFSAESYSRAGDYVVMRALDDLTCVSTACPDDIDPINGWNPTDVHVRIYHEEARIQHAVAYREKENAPMNVSQHSAFHEKTSVLTKHFAPARDLWVPVSFPAAGTIGEYWATREAVTVQDMSGLRKFDVIGPDAEKVLQLATTRDVSKLAVHRGHYTLMCDDSGEVIDDGTLFRLAPEIFRWCCGTEESGRALQEAAQNLNAQARVHALGNSLPNLAIQGPNSRDLLHKIVFTQPTAPSLEHLKWFGVTVARINDRDGAPFMLSRSGYTGELGYEIFCASDHANEIWDAVMEAGQEFGIQPMGGAALDILRIEAGLAASHAEFAPGVDALEAGLGFAVDFRKPEFIGKTALERNAKDPRRVLTGIAIDCEDDIATGAPVLVGERQVGVITSATRSPKLEKTIAMARLNVEYSQDGQQLSVGLLDGRMKQLNATVCPFPFYDPKRIRARA